MRRMVVGLIAGAGMWLAAAPSAWALDTAQVSATVAGGNQIAVQVSGSTDPCSYCSAEAVQIEAQADPDGYLSSCSPNAPQVTNPISTGGGSYSFTSSIPVPTGQSYQVCGYVMQTSFGTDTPSAESDPVIVTVAPTACPPGTEHALTLTAPWSVPIGTRGEIDVAEDPSSTQGESPWF